MNPISEAIQLKQQLDALRPLSAADEQRIMQKFRLDWNYHSNNLEGNSLTYGETKALILFGITAQGKPLKDHFEVVGHNEAVEWILEVLKDERPLSENFIRELHQLILKEPYQVDAITPDGQPTKKWIKVGVYKTEPNHVKTKTGEIFRFASPEETPAKMQELIEWYRAESEKETVNAILLAATFHYRFIRIHPFDDGNGRTVRILMNFILMHFGFPPVIIKTEDKASYLSALAQADAGILEPFVNYIAENLVHSLEIMLKGARGESIEDPDDLDKQIALLEAQLNGDKIEKTKSEETLKEWFDTVLPVIVEQFVEVNEKFRRFYVTQDYQLLIKKDKALLDGYGEILDVDSQYFEYSHFVKEDFFKMYNSLDVHSLVGELLEPENSSTKNSLIIRVNFNTFNKSTFQFDNISHLGVYFNDVAYSLWGSSFKEVIKKYNTAPTEAELNTLLKAEANAHLAFIQEKLKGE